MKFMMYTKKYTHKDCKMNHDILDELKAESELRKLLDYRKKWICNVGRMQNGTPQIKDEVLGQETKGN